ncbi:bifunctional metallophosphatase/5'-nucleotidase [Piscibacillus halophilus]|mgnify:CR=1 FL=1|uniref:2',3'-cyclic-nucleotide 2'-phosphodiesterase/5'-or 3'-nucleotidase, 5'-nucleotidase family n=1 Tax=Piscibacillus halophilus TaxID=571933 RepID=A0A1H9EUD5_9BACI|nr:bifunctional UDP-sugar hydrolase/5'-nucleotidase [Piscibacillus halophilus]SEQ29281.1 2',3'-cyclic-nucleotide 2'-phosphodiesterase/5'-or 3'-nucleotidase, 5'-nucleotidase family [Piscibacillus halophilus]
MKETLHFYFTSDLHSHFENWPKIMHDIKEKTYKHQLDEEFYMLLDNGDHMDRSHPISEASLGKDNIELLNHSNFEVATLGNNEGITLPSEQLFHLYDDAEFDVVCANIKPIKGPSPKWLKPYQVYETPSGINIGVIGLTAPFQAFYEKLGWKTLSPLETLEQWLPEIKAQTDVMIVLSHLGINSDETMAERYDIDLIMGGHTHHLLNQGQEKNGTLITAVGKHGYYYGDVSLTFDHNQRKVVQKEGYAIPIENEAEDQKSKILLEQLNEKAEDQLSRTVAHLKQPYPINWLNETPLMNAFVNTLRHWTKSDCAMLNSGVLLTGFEKGPVTRRDVHQSCPHPMNPCVMVLTGRELIETVRMIEQERFIHFELKGLGFRGKKIGKMVYSNLTIDYHDETNYVETVFVNGEKVDPHTTYTVATADTFSFPWLVPPISSVKEKHYFLPEFLRDVLEECLSTLN